MRAENPGNVPGFCKHCEKLATCPLCEDEQLRERCPYLQEDDSLSYKNSEGYADPTTFFALRNIEWEQQAKRKTNRQEKQEKATVRSKRMQNTTDRPKNSPATKTKPNGKRRFNTQVIHYN